MQTHTNQRGHHEVYWTWRHLRLDHLKQEARGEKNQYLFKENIPVSPQLEVHVTHVKHDTEGRGLYRIWSPEGFRGSCKDSLLWRSLSVSPDEITATETRILRDAFPVRTEEQAAAQPTFLWKFATSLAFLETSRLGSYRLTFPLQELLRAYSHQLCDCDQPVMRVYKTSLFKQEVMYTVLVHSLANQELFSEFPLLSDQTDAVCVYKDGRFI